MWKNQYFYSYVTIEVKQFSNIEIHRERFRKQKKFRE